MKLKIWIKAFRLRTLPLALSTIITGSFLAIASGTYKWSVIGLSVLTTVLLQVLSNLANDFGDGMKGTDNVNRLGPQRAIQSGEISPKQMKTGIIILIIFTLISGICLIFEALGTDWYLGLVFLALGISAIVASIKYTVGKKSYGYSGLGVLFVFVFFGLLAVLGSYFLNTLQLKSAILLPAASMGLLSTAVLNLNNMRDFKNDINSGKNTIAGKLGLRNAKKYHYTLIFVALLSAVLYTFLSYSSPWNLIYILTFPIFLSDLIQISRTKEEKKLDHFLKRLALSTLLFSVLFGVGLLV